MIRTTMFCLAVAMCWRAAMGNEWLQAQTVEMFTAHYAHDEAVVYVSGGASGNWLTIQRANLADYERRGFDPSYSYVLSDFKPLVKKLSNGKWEITFTSDVR
jgi:hypothetical protein